MNTRDAIAQCARWARQLGIGRNENPFSKYLTHQTLSTYWQMWDSGWELEDTRILAVATLQSPASTRDLLTASIEVRTLVEELFKARNILGDYIPRPGNPPDLTSLNTILHRYGF